MKSLKPTSCHIPPSLLIPYKLFLPGEKLNVILFASHWKAKQDFKV